MHAWLSRRTCTSDLDTSNARIVVKFTFNIHHHFVYFGPTVSSKL